MSDDSCAVCGCAMLANDPETMCAQCDFAFAEGYTTALADLVEAVFEKHGHSAEYDDIQKQTKALLEEEA